jgi:hypothetical protein
MVAVIVFLVVGYLYRSEVAKLFGPGTNGRRHVLGCRWDRSLGGSLLLRGRVGRGTFLLGGHGVSPRATARVGKRRACRAAVPGEEDYLDRADDSRQLWTKSSRF